MPRKVVALCSLESPHILTCGSRTSLNFPVYTISLVQISFVASNRVEFRHLDLDMAHLIGNELTGSEDGKREHTLAAVLPVPETEWSGL
jgi:hypothetical protein